MNPPSFSQFEAESVAEGYDEVLVREWAPGQVVPEHAHPFDVKARVVRGDLALTAAGHTRRFEAGSGFELERGQPHAEHYGPEGATFWVARRHAD
jgi:quercetin dioxygenase-like cupin family protein